MFGLWSEELGGPVQRFSTQVIALLGWRWIQVIGATFLTPLCPGRIGG